MRETATQTITGIVLTHWHLDHIGGVPSVMKYLGSLNSTTSKAPEVPPPVYKYMPQNHAPRSAADGPAINPYAVWPKDKVC